MSMSSPPGPPLAGGGGGGGAPPIGMAGGCSATVSLWAIHCFASAAQSTVKIDLIQVYAFQIDTSY